MPQPFEVPERSAEKTLGSFMSARARGSVLNLSSISSELSWPEERSPAMKVKSEYKTSRAERRKKKHTRLQGARRRNLCYRPCEQGSM